MKKYGEINNWDVSNVTSTWRKLKKGVTYTFNQSDPSNNNHPLRFENIDGIQTSSYVTSIGTPGTTGAWVFFVVSQNPSIIKYVCANHGSSMGNFIDFTD